MSENTRKLLSLLMAVAMLLSMLPMGMTAQAQSVEQAPVVEAQKPEELTPVTDTVPGTTVDAQTGARTLVLGENTVEITEAGAMVDCTFVPAETGIYNFYSVSDRDTYAYLLDAEGNELTRDDDSGNGNNFMISRELTAGCTYTLRVRFYGLSDTGSIPVVAERSPLVSVSLSPVSVIEGTNGEFEINREDGENYGKMCFYYDVYDIMGCSTITATFADGSVVTGTDGYVTYNGQVYTVSHVSESEEHSQSYDSQWTPGNTYTITALFMNMPVEFEVTITPTPLQSITIHPIDVIENTCGSVATGWDSESQSEQEFYYYNWAPMLDKCSYTATFADGTVVNGTGRRLEYNGNSYEIRGIIEQSYDSQWTIGNSYSFTAYTLGCYTQVSVNITEVPLESLTFAPVEIIEGTCGYFEIEWNDETKTQHKYYRYSQRDIMQQVAHTAAFTDGAVITGTGVSLSYEGEEYQFTYSAEAQTYENPWTAGNTYYINVSVFGQSYQVPVTIVASPIVSLTFTPVMLRENTNGQWYYHWDSETQREEAYYYYSYYSFLWRSEYTLTFADGTVVTGNGNSSLEYNGQSYPMDYEVTQDYENQWTLGNTYYVDVTIMGYHAQVPVTIIGMPWESITFAPVTVVEGTYGGWHHQWSFETHSYSEDYYYYEHSELLSLTEYTVRFTDGTELTGTGSSFTYQGEEYYFETRDTQDSERPWLAGNDYSLTVLIDGYETQVPVTIVPSALESITVTPVEIVEGMNRYLANGWNPEIGELEPYQRYDTDYIMDNTTYRAVFNDGTVVTGTGSALSYNGKECEIYYYDLQRKDHEWTAGNTYYIKVYLLGRETELPVTVVPNPLESITLTPVELVEHTNGGWYYGTWDSETQSNINYFHYRCWDVMERSTYTAIFRDGTVLTGRANEGFTYNGRYYEFSCDDPQSYENQWTLGNTYYLDVSVMGQAAQIPVTITTIPLVSLTFEPVTVMEKTNGYLSEEGGAEYYYYNPYQMVRSSQYTAVFADGTELTGYGEGFHYGEDYYSFYYSSNQSADNPWLPGNTYSVEVTVGDYVAQVPVTVEASPLESLTFQPITVIEGSCGGVAYGWNSETQTEEPYFLYYEWDMLERTQFTATFADGTTQTGVGNSSLKWEDNYYGFSWSSYQEWNEPWTVGNTYYIHISVMGIDVEVPVTIVPSPVVSLTVEPVTMTENRGGSLNSYWPGDGNEYTYYTYHWANRLQYTVTMNDGSVFTGTNGAGFNYQNQWYYINAEDNQGWENQWTVGNTYTATASVMGVSAPVTVTIVPAVKQPLSLGENLVVIENAGDEMDTLFTPTESGQYTFYSQTYAYEDTYAVLYDAKGNWLTSDDDGGSNGNFKISWNLTAGETYTLRVRYYSSSKIGTIPVYVKAYPVASIVFDPVVMEEHAGGDWYSQDYYQYYWQRNITFTITFKDGTVKQGSFYNPVEYDGVYYGVGSISDDQSYDNPWLAGNTYPARAEFGGKWYDVYVSVCRKTEDNGFTYMLQDGKAIITGCTMKPEILQIPETIEGCPVVGITSLGEALNYAAELRIPDSVTMLSADFLTVDGNYYGSVLPLKKLTVGTGVAALSQRMLYCTGNLECIEIAADNPYLCSVDGVVYNKALTALVAYPPAKTDLHVMPDSVTDVSVLFDYSELYVNINVQFGAGVKDYKMVDGIIYNSDMTRVVKATASATGSYVMPESVSDIASYAFSGSNLTAVSVSPNVTEIVYTMFYGHSKLEEITIPVGVRAIDMWGNLDSLQKIHITDLEYWCNYIWFGSNPLEIAHDLYLNGEKIVDLVFPETVAEGVYTQNKINRYAFAGASFESVTIPSRIADIGYNAFADCENLQKVYISDLGAWSGTSFANARANPLYYAHDLYLNGEKIVDLVLPETVADRIYSQYFGETIGVNNYAFYNASIETVTVPETVQVIGSYAFEGCENLTKVNISDLAAWCRIEFDNASANPLSYARNLYLNGEKITDLVLPELVTDSVYVTDLAYGVGNYAFFNIDIDSLTVPSHVQKIGDEAFYGSTVEQITFEEGIDTIGYSAFEGSNVKALDLPDSLVCIRSCAFLGCRDLETVSFGDGLLTIYYAAFADTGVKSVELPDSLYYLGSEAFAECQNLTYVDFGNTLNEVSYACFRNTGLKTVTLPKQIEIVNASAFEGSALTEVIFDCDAVEIYSSAFANCPLGDLELGDNIKVTDPEAFAGTNATQIKLPASVTEISYRVYAFNENLVSVTIPDTVTYIDPAAFEGDNLLSHVLYTGTEEQWYAMNNYSEHLLNATLHCQAVGNEVTTSQTCTTVTYHCAICDKTETLRKGNATHTFDENEVCTVCGYEGYWEYEVNKDGTVTVTGYTGPDNEPIVPHEIEGLPVTAFTRETFAYNRDIILVELPAGITEIPAEAFYNCSNLWQVVLGDKVTTIGDRAFYGCYWLENMELPDSVTTIGSEAFRGVTFLDFKLPKSLTTLGLGAFSGSYLYTDCLEIPAGVTEITYGAFAGCRNLKELILPDTVTTIGYYAFSATGITELTIPASVKDIGAYAFDNNNIETLTFLGDQPYMEDAFDNSGITVFYPGANKTWRDLPEDSNSWYACNVPVITRQPVSQTVENGQTVTFSAEAYGHRLSYQWYYAAPGAKKFTPVGGDSIELTMTVDKTTAQGKVYCLVTDVLGQTAKTNTVTLRNPAETTGIRLSQLPYTLEYDMRQELRTRGLEVMLTFSDGSEEMVTDYIVTGYDANVGGKQTITVTYGQYTATFAVTVNQEKLNFTNTEEKIEISAPEGAVESNVELVVEKVYNEAQLPELPEMPEIIQENNAVIFDITLEKEGEAVQPEKTVQVSIPVPEHMESKRCKVYHIADDGSVTDMNAQYKDGRMVFDTDHFSYYAVVEVEGVTITGKLSGASDMAGAEVKLLSGGEVLETAVVSKNGTYRFDNVVANDYEIEAVQDGLPTKKVSMSVLDQDLIIDILMAILGDIDGNEQITRDDVIRLLLHVTMPNRFPLDAEADFDGDGNVTRNDVIRLLLHVTMPNRFPLAT